LQSRYAGETGIAALKIRHNNILGYFIEVPPKSADKMPPSYIHRQTMASAVRYTTPELNELEQKLARAKAQMLAMEIEIFDSLVHRVKQSAGAIQGAAHALARLDVIGGLARLAGEENYRRPMVDDSLAFDISGGRHAVVEQYLRRTQTPFIANDCRLQSDDGRLWLITGPNMAGKSTYLRQNALVAIMAQIGSFVPAEKCHIGVIDKIFSRVGAGDDLARGQSTFMVEMVETAGILNGATARSLVILDEIGRGTATFDGLSIAWASLEYLHDRNQCRGLFATHYHELTALTGQLVHLRTHSMQVKEWQGDIIFLHQVAPGHAQRSYGIHVAKLAGLPVDVVARARQILADLETGRHDHASPSAPIARNKISDELGAMALEQLMALSIDDLSPRAAWDMLAQLQSMIRKAP
jgi:DNA mismatch repair protein MutS